jgi:Tfp pilus assembly protein PilW
MTNKFFRRRAGGYALVELMVVVALLAILVLSVIGMFLTLLKTGGKTQALARIKQEGDYATITMERLIRGGKNVTTCSGSDLVFTVPNAITITVSLVGGKIVLNDGVAREITSDKVTASNLVFTCEPKDVGHGHVVGFSFNLRVASADIDENFQSSVAMRNY